MKICCGTNMYASFPLETALKELSAIGFRYIDLWACKAICDHADPDRTTPEEVRCLLKKYQIEAVSMTLFLMDRKERLKRMEFASKLGIPVVIWEPAQSPDWKACMANLNPVSVPYGQSGAGMAEYFSLLREDMSVAASLGLKVGIEVPHCYTQNEYLYQIYRMDQEIRGNGLMYILAPPHANARGYEAEDVYRLVDPRRVYMLYLWDVKKEFSFPESDRAFGSGDEQLPGGGKRDFALQINTFREMGFDGWYNISCHGTEGWTDIKRVTAGVKKAWDMAIGILDESCS